MEPFVSLSIVIIFVLWLNYEIFKSNRLSKKSRQEFLKKESQANQTRKVDISHLNYIQIPYDKLPMKDYDDATINSYRDIILSQSDKKILNLSGLSNTELKLKYGAANINLLAEYDNNFTVLVSILQKWGERLYQQGYYKEALAVLETAIDCKTDVRKTYELLARIYLEQGSPDKINELIKLIPTTGVRNQDELISKLLTLKNLD